MRGFFHKSELLAMGSKPTNTEARCDVCRLYKTCVSPKMPHSGKGRQQVLIVAEAPGAKEDERNTQLIGKAGQRLRSTLDNFGIDLDEDCYKTNAVICRPPKNRTPTEHELEHCRPNFVDTLNQTNPLVIITLGDTALKQVLAPYWLQEFGPIGRWVGWQIPLQPLNTWVCPTWHSSYIERENDSLLSLCFQQHLEAAFAKGSRPWKEVPNYESMVEQTDEPSNILEEMKEYDGWAAFDFECNTLKPEDPDAVCVSAAIAWGKKSTQRCVAYPMVGDNRKLTRKFLRSPIPKVAANMKFEERWAMKHFDTRVRNWAWDTMQCAHVLDNRPGITGLDFQAMVRLGLPPYSDHIKPLLKAKKGVTVNQILSEISTRQLLTYNGLDVITELELASLQMRELRQPPPWRS